MKNSNSNTAPATEVTKPAHNMALCFRTPKEAAEAKTYVVDAADLFGQLEERSRGSEGKVMYISRSPEGDAAIAAICAVFAKANKIFTDEKKFGMIIHHSVTLDWYSPVSNDVVQYPDGSLSTSMSTSFDEFFPFNQVANYDLKARRHVEGWHFGLAKVGVITLKLDVDGNWTITEQPYQCVPANDKVNRAVGLEWKRIVLKGQTEPVENEFDDVDDAANCLFRSPDKKDWFYGLADRLVSEMASAKRLTKRLQDEIGLNTLGGRIKGNLAAAAGV